MADEHELDENTANEEDEKPQKKVAKHDSGAADLEKVTDYAEEKEISSQDIIGVSTLAYFYDYIISMACTDYFIVIFKHSEVYKSKTYCSNESFIQILCLMFQFHVQLNEYSYNYNFRFFFVISWVDSCKLYGWPQHECQN